MSNGGLDAAEHGKNRRLRPVRTISHEGRLNLDGRQIAAARALVAMSQAQLADKAGISVGVVIGHESGTSRPRPSSVAAMRHALEDAGVRFIPHGVALAVG